MLVTGKPCLLLMGDSRWLQYCCSHTAQPCVVAFVLPACSFCGNWLPLSSLWLPGVLWGVAAHALTDPRLPMFLPRCPQAYISQMVFLLAPLLVSWLALVLLRTPLPPKFW